MRATQTSRLLAVLLLLQLGGLIVPFVMLHPIAHSPGYSLAHAAAVGSQLKLALALLLTNCVLTVGISLVVFACLRRERPRLATLLLIASVVMLALQAVDTLSVLSIISLSEQYAAANGAGRDFVRLATALAAARKGPHYGELVAIDVWMALLYGSLLSGRLVPNALAGFGLMTVALHFGGIVLPGLLGHRGMTALGVPMAFAELALVLWLFARGLAMHAEPTHSATPRTDMEAV